MLERFYPNEYINSVEDIDFDMYYKQGIRGVIFDIDNTLVPHGHPAMLLSSILQESLTLG